MKIKKSTFKWMVWVLAFFFMAAGIAEGADRCRKKCCQEWRVDNNPEVQEISFYPETSLDALLPPCHLSGPSKVVRKAISEDVACSNESTPYCCHMGKDRTSVQAVVFKSQFGRANRLFPMDTVIHVQPRNFFNEHEARFVVMERMRHPSDAPVPLYLKNTSFIC